MLTELADLLFPTDCPGCGALGLSWAICPGCRSALAVARAGPVRPDPAPPGLPPCVALGPYDGILRELVLGYKERGRLGLVGPLAGGLATAVAAASPDQGRLVLVPVPATAAAVRTRGCDHVLRLAHRAAGFLCRAGRPTEVRSVLRARPRRADSTRLGAAERFRQAAATFRPRPYRLGRLADTGARVEVVLIDDIVTTGATLAAATRILRAAGIAVRGAAVLAATQRHRVDRTQGEVSLIPRHECADAPMLPFTDERPVRRFRPVLSDAAKDTAQFLNKG